MSKSAWIVIAVVTVANAGFLAWTLTHRGADGPGPKGTPTGTSSTGTTGTSPAGPRAGNGGPGAGATDAKRNQTARLTKIDRHQYLAGYKNYERRRNGVVENRSTDRFAANLLVNARYPEATLFDMGGRVLHRWTVEFPQAFPKPLSFNPVPVCKTRFRRAVLLANGDLLTMFGGVGLVLLSPVSMVKWSLPNQAHHSIDVGGDDKIYTLGLEMVPRKYTYETHTYDGDFRRDTIDVVRMDGTLEKKVSVMRAFLNSDYASILEFGKFGKDILHTNSVQWLDGSLAAKIPAFKRGHVLISVRNLHTIAVVDLEREKVVWAMSGMWKFQHEATQLRNGNILLFDNMGAVRPPVANASEQSGVGTSRILEINPVTQEVVWVYGEKEDQRFLSLVCGVAQRLHDGNTLITSSVDGQAREVTPAGETVWLFNSAAKVDGKIATMFQVSRHDARLPALFVASKPPLRPVGF